MTEQGGTARYVTRDGYFAEIILPDPSWLERARERLAEMTDEERREAAARYIAARYGLQPGQVPPDHPDAGKLVAWGEHPRDCDCGDCP